MRMTHHYNRKHQKAGARGTVTDWLRFTPGNGRATLLLRSPKGRELSLEAPRKVVEKAIQALKDKSIRVLGYGQNRQLVSEDGVTVEFPVGQEQDPRA